MRIPRSFIDELLSRLSVTDIVGRHVQLRAKPGGEYTGLCPFHDEKTPSFTVSGAKGFYHCFGCGAHGTSIDFLKEHKGLSFVEAVQFLANEAGLSVPKASREEVEKEKRTHSLLEVVECAAAWFESQLHMPEARHALRYLKDRGVNEAQIKHFRIGYAPDGRNALQQYCQSQSIDMARLQEAGLAMQPDSGLSYDRFRSRIIFPILNQEGHVVAFGGRLLGDGKPKYLNSPETPLFHKSDILYHWHHARDVAFKTQQLILAEGYMDVIALHQYGFEETVAPLGTSVTERQLQMAWRVTPEPIICLDGDEAGKRAMNRAARLSLPLLKPGKSLRFVSLPKSMDPDDLLRRDGAQAMQQLLDNAVPLAEALWLSVNADRALKTPEQNASLEHELMGLVQQIQDPTVKHYYRQYIKDRLWEMQRGKRKQASRRHENTAHLHATLGSQVVGNSKRQQYEKILLSLVIRYPECMLSNHEMEEAFLHLEIEEEGLREIHQHYVDYLSEHSDINADALLASFEATSSSRLIAQLLQDPFVYSSIPNAEKHSNIAMIVVHCWEYIVAQYDYVLFEEEYERSLQQTQEGVAEHLWELKKQKDALKKLVETKKIAYEAALEF